MSETHLKRPGFTYSSCGLFTRNKVRIQKFMQTGDTHYIYRNDLDKASFQHNMAYDNHKDLVKKTESDKVLRDKCLKWSESDPKWNGYERGLA